MLQVSKLESYLAEGFRIRKLIERSFFERERLQAINTEKTKSLDELNLEQLIIDLKSLETQIFFIVESELKEQLGNASSMIDTIAKNNELDYNNLADSMEEIFG